MPLTSSQLATLKTAITGNSTTIPAGHPWSGAFVGTAINALPNSTDANTAVAGWYNLNASPSFTVWKTMVTLSAIGDAMVATELAGLTSLNIDRLAVIATYGPNGINPSLADRRAAFDDIFSGAGGANTRAALLALWKRLARNGEKLFATGTGSDASPAILVFEGLITGSDVNSALNLP